MASRKPKVPEPPRSLRDQVKALELPRVAARPPPAPVPQPKRPAAGDDLTFEQLASRILPTSRVTEPAHTHPPRAASAIGTPRAARTRMWVERSESSVRARAEDAPERLMQDLERGRVVPRRELDLHRQSAAGARQILDLEIPRARKDGVLCLLVVCGRGMHSAPEGPVLPDVVIERLSEELESDVLAFTTAPRKWGGQGALIVCLRATAPD
jgi:DNA-nicking Smr family endonuclease